LTFVTIVNDSDNPFVLDRSDPNNPADIRFEIRRAKAEKDVPRTNPAPMVERLKLKPDEKRDLLLDLSLWYEVTEIGPYLARVVAVDSRGTYASPQVGFDVVGGIELKSVTREVPTYDDLTRTYSLRTWTREGGEYLFLRIDEQPSQLNYGLYKLGPLVRILDPTLDVDRAGTVKVLHQTGFDCFTKSVFKSDRNEVRMVEQTYLAEDGSPYDPKKESVKRQEHLKRIMEKGRVLPVEKGNP
jgi:hypothetical protein